MENGDPLSEVPSEYSHKLRGKGDLGHHDYRLLSQFNTSSDKLYIYSGLSAAGHSVKQCGRSFLRLQQFFQAEIRIGLLLIEAIYHGYFRFFITRDAEHFPALQLNVAPLFQRTHRLH